MDLTPIGTKTTNTKISHLELTPVGTKTPDPNTLTLPTELSKQNGKEHVPEDLESDPSLLDSSSSEYDLSYDIKYIKSKSKRRD